MKRICKFIQFSFLTISLCLLMCFNAHASQGLSSKKVYITFDDGPTFITSQLLDILKKEDVKATFFVVGKEIEGREDILKRIYSEGHSIGLHTYSHNLMRIYKNEDVFIDEMIKTSNKIKEVTGCTTNIMRFPGGTSRRLNKAFLTKLHEKNFKIYDWNADIYDGEFPELSVYRLTENAKRTKRGYSDIIILMHCNSNNKNTVRALPKIIKYYRDEGCTLLPIKEDTKEYYYKF